MKLAPVSAHWPLAVLCLLLSIRWAFADPWPGTQSSLSSQAVAALLGAGICLVLARRGKSGGEQSNTLVPAALCGVLLFVGLNLGLLFPDAMPKGTDLLISLSLTPVVIAVALVALGQAPDGISGQALVPGLFASAGLLLILPQPAVSSWAKDAVLVLSPLCVGLGAAVLGKLLLRADHADEPTRRALVHRKGAAAGTAAAALAAAGCVLGSFALVRSRFAPALAATGLDLVTVLLSLLALRRSGVRRFAAQFTIVPLLLLLEGLLLNRVHPSWQQAGGLLLLLTASVLLLQAPHFAEPEESPHLLA